jgi:hypothetical protein
MNQRKAQRFKKFLPLARTNMTVDEFLSTSMPELIYPSDPNFGLDDPKFNRELLKKLNSKKSRISLDLAITVEGRTHNLLETGLGQDGYIYFVLDDRILYLVRYKVEKIGLLEETAVTQFLVWSDRSFVHTTGLAARVFFQHLLKRHRLILSDYTQTRAGMGFWVNRITEALSKKLYVYMLDSRYRKLEKIEDSDDLQRNSSHWREDGLGKFYRFAISDHPLTLKDIK